AAIWAEVLRVEKVGIHDNFFELGGHSLLATRVIARIRESLKVDLLVRALFEANTVFDLSLRVETARREDQGPSLPLVPQTRDDTTPLSFAQERLWLLEQISDYGG
ncbi:phosphopantetheine-binding protein, partial [Rhizobium leguminosarum]|uniref:phosphopantetheine-binding protein n=1 Tax=Rhizobium leguminosarum TaxID=384 RepID=UPI003F9E230D